jgi:NAD-dependent dihydropyrimidine dehydrogenase PreA subunit
MTSRKIVQIDEEKCNGCGLCIPNCAEGALKIIDGKARLIGDIFCDGLGACLGHCPEDAIKVIEREAEAFDEKAVEAHLHAPQKGPHRPEPRPKPEPVSFCGCPSSKPMQLKMAEPDTRSTASRPAASMLSHWPVQLKLVPVQAPYFKDADLLIVADCVPFAYPNFHQDFLQGKAVVVGCPKLDDIEFYTEKLRDLFRVNTLKSITLPFMEVPCCSALVRAVEEALQASGKEIPLKKVKIGIQGDILPEREERSFHHPRGPIRRHT